MNIIGDWKIKKVLSFGDSGMCYKPAEEVAAENPDMASLLGLILRFYEDGTYISMMPLPEGIDIEEAKKEIAEKGGDGPILIDDRYFADKPKEWKEEDGVVKYNTGGNGTILDKPVDPWVPVEFDEDGLFSYLGLYKLGKVED